MLQTVYFTKTFTSGLFKGLSVHGKITTAFPLQWRKGTTGKDITGNKYIITDASFQNYQRG